MTANPPTNLTELLDHLAAHPRFRVQSRSAAAGTGVCEFAAFTDGTLWYRGPSGRLRCFDLETGFTPWDLTFGPDGFSLDRAGVTITCTYQE